MRAAIDIAATITVARALAAVRPLKAQTVRETPWDVIVVGGGLAGLAAAEAVAAAGRRVLVLEAQGRLGGRVDTGTYQLAGHGSIVIERGAQLFHAEMKEVRALLRRAGISERLLPVDATAVRVDSARRDIISGDAGIGDLDIGQLERALATGDRSLEELLVLLADDARRRAHPLDTGVLASALTELMGLSLSSVSARGALDIMRTQDGFHDDDRQASDGLDGMVRVLAGSLPVAPRLNAPVAAIRRHASGIAVHLAEASLAATPLLARRVIVAVPPTVARRIEIDGTPAIVREALDAWAPGQMTKITAVFADRFWQTAPQSPGTAIVVEPSGITVRDVSRPDETFGRVVIFAGGPAGRAWASLDDAALGREVQALLARAFNRPVPEPLVLVAGRWVDHPWSGGGYNSWPTAGGPSDVRRVLREVRGNVVFAGSELSMRYAGYMEGAIHSGRDAARRVVRTLAEKRG